MRLFYLNAEEVFDAREICERTKMPARKVRYEINLLKKIGFVANGTKEILVFTSKKGRARKKKIKGWTINPQFSFLRPLKALLLNAAPVPNDQMLRRLKSAGTLKLVVLTGFFLNGKEGSQNGKVDVLVVGDNLKKTKIDSVMRFVESKVGKELNYAILTSKEFQYRMGMYDKFIRDIFDYPHEKLIDKFGL